jgi:hypothetical protein
LWSHKVCRWFAPWAAVAAGGALLVLARHEPWAQAVLAVSVLALVLAGFGWLWPEQRPMPRLLAIPAFLIGGNVAVLHACWRALRGEMDAMWEPTRREVVDAP